MPLPTPVILAIVSLAATIVGIVIASVAITLAKKSTGIVSVTSGGTGLGRTTTGDVLYSSEDNTMTALSGNSTTTRCFLSQTGLGTTPAAPTWDVLLASDVPASSLTVKSNATNLQFNVEGDANKSVLAETKVTMNWTGALQVKDGGTGLQSINQGDVLIGGDGNTILTLSGNTTSNNRFLRQVGLGGVATPPVWASISYSDLDGSLPFITHVEASQTLATKVDVQANYTALQNAIGLKLDATNVQTGVWNATLVLQIYDSGFNEIKVDGQYTTFQTSWNWTKIGSVVFMRCSMADTSGHVSNNIYPFADAQNGVKANINCQTPLPTQIRPNTWTTTNDNVSLYSNFFETDSMGKKIPSTNVDQWQYQTAIIQFSPLTQSTLNSGIRMYYLAGGNFFDGWSTGARVKGLVLPATTYVYSI